MDTYTASLYIYTDIKSVKPSEGRFMWVWEFTEKAADGGVKKFDPPLTVTSADQKNGRYVSEKARQRIMANRRTAQLDAFIDALEHFGARCLIDLHVPDANFAAVFLNHWINGWHDKGWVKSDGEKIACADKWQRLYELLSSHELTMVSSGYNSYTSWFENECEVWKRSESNKKINAINTVLEMETEFVKSLEILTNTDILHNDNLAKSLFNLSEKLSEKLKAVLNGTNTDFKGSENSETQITSIYAEAGECENGLNAGF